MQRCAAAAFGQALQLLPMPLIALRLLHTCMLVA
jgi:hypothetical protein